MPRLIRIIAWSELAGGIIGFAFYLGVLVRGGMPGGVVNGVLGLFAFAIAAAAGWFLRQDRTSGYWGSVVVYTLQCFQLGTPSILLQFVTGLQAPLILRSTEWKVSPGVGISFSAAPILGDQEPFVAVNFFALGAVGYLLWRLSRSEVVAPALRVHEPTGSGAP